MILDGCSGGVNLAHYIGCSCRGGLGGPYLLAPIFTAVPEAVTISIPPDCPSTS